jgi:flagellar basal body-associated protein FliL
MSDQFTPMPDAPVEKKSNKTIIIVVVVLLVLCCCCAVIASGFAFKDSFLQLYNSMP